MPQRNPREDQAETARHLMSVLPDALVQIVDEPDLPGSQRIMHVLKEYEQASLDGPGIDFFVDVALDRVPHDLDQIMTRLKAYASGGGNGIHGVAGDPSGARATLAALARYRSEEIPTDQVAELVQLSAKVTGQLIVQRIRPKRGQRSFHIWGSEDKKRSETGRSAAM